MYVCMYLYMKANENVLPQMNILEPRYTIHTRVQSVKHSHMRVHTHLKHTHMRTLLNVCTPHGHTHSGRGRRGKSQKEWQSAMRWKYKIISLTLPRIEPPMLRSVGRTNVTLTWKTPFSAHTQTQANDATPFGYTLTYHSGHKKEVWGPFDVVSSVVWRCCVLVLCCVGRYIAASKECSVALSGVA